MVIRQNFVKGGGFVNYSTRLRTCPTMREGQKRPNNKIELRSQVDSQHIMIVHMRVTYSMLLHMSSQPRYSQGLHGNLFFQHDFYEKLVNPDRNPPRRVNVTVVIGFPSHHDKCPPQLDS